MRVGSNRKKGWTLHDQRTAYEFASRLDDTERMAAGR